MSYYIFFINGYRYDDKSHSAPIMIGFCNDVLRRLSFCPHHNSSAFSHKKIAWFSKLFNERGPYELLPRLSSRNSK